VLCCGFLARAIRFQQVTAAGDAAYYLRTGGLLHHWMVYAAVEVMIFGALLEFWSERPKDRKWMTLALAVNSLGILCSLTRSLWVACFLLLVAHVAWRRPRALWALPLIPLLVLALAPAPLKQRAVESIDRNYYSNAERIQMWSVGWKMIRQHPLTGIGPGNVERLYPAFVPPGEPLPSYHGHLHNNALQLGAEFGLPVLCAAVWFTVMLAKDLARALPDFYCRIGLMGLAGFLMIGMTDYSYGHSLGLILLAFTALSPLMQKTASQSSAVHRDRKAQLAA
jgi:O-antigen ligase